MARKEFDIVYTNQCKVTVKLNDIKYVVRNADDITALKNGTAITPRSSYTRRNYRSYSTRESAAPPLSNNTPASFYPVMGRGQQSPYAGPTQQYDMQQQYASPVWGYPRH